MYRVFSGPQGSRQGIFMVFKKNAQKSTYQVNFCKSFTILSYNERYNTTIMTNQQTQWQQCHEEANRLRRELKALNASRATLTDPAEIEAKKKEAHQLQTQYNAVLEQLKALKDEYEWNKSINREFDTLGL